MPKPNTIERRYIPITDFALRADAEYPLSGYASVFNTPANIGGWWIEEVAPGAFAKTIMEHDIRALWNHDPNIVLGRNKAKTLRLSEDAHGLKSEIKPPDNEWGRPVVDAIKRGDVTQMSIAFRAIKQIWYRPEPDSGELPKRTITEAKLYDVSPVTYPAFESTSISARDAGLATVEGEDRDILEVAARLARCAQRGLVLTRADRELIAAAAEIFNRSLATGEPEANEAHHSTADASDKPEADEAHHLFAQRTRRLELVRMSLA